MTQIAYQYESNLVENIIKGCSESEAELVEKYQAGLVAMLRTRCQDPQMVEDVMQDAWLVILRKLRAGDLKDTRRLSGFVTQISRNQMITAFRKNQRQIATQGELDHDPEDSKAGPVDLIENKQLGKAMAEMLRSMSRPRDRELLIRFYFYGNSKLDLCKQFDLSPASFDTILARARDRFKKTWKKHR